MKTINRVGVLSVAKVLAALYALLGVIFGAFMALFSVIGAGLGQASGAEGAWIGVLFGGGALSAFLYNHCSGVVGGAEIEIE